MKKILIIALISLTSLFSIAQNVGIGTTTPAEKLDVNGNVNIQGKLIVNGVSGQPGQILRTNSLGATEWTDNSEFKNYVTFYENGSLLIPPGVSRIKVELWGGGGGGAYGGGGGSGGYSTGIFTVTPDDLINILVGLGGDGAVTSGNQALDGNGSSVNGPTVSCGAPGGNAATAGRPGIGGGISGGSQINNSMTIRGNSGEATTESYDQVSSTHFARVTKFGNGGHGTIMNFGGGQGGFLSYNTTTSQNIKLIYSCAASSYGGGGAGGPTTLGAFQGGSKAANGMVIIWY